MLIELFAGGLPRILFGNRHTFKRWYDDGMWTKRIMTKFYEMTWYNIPDLAKVYFSPFCSERDSSGIPFLEFRSIVPKRLKALLKAINDERVARDVAQALPTVLIDYIVEVMKQPASARTTKWKAVTEMKKGKPDEAAARPTPIDLPVVFVEPKRSSTLEMSVCPAGGVTKFDENIVYSCRDSRSRRVCDLVLVDHTRKIIYAIKVTYESAQDHPFECDAVKALLLDEWRLDTAEACGYKAMLVLLNDTTTRLSPAQFTFLKTSMKFSDWMKKAKNRELIDEKLNDTIGVIAGVLHIKVPPFFPAVDVPTYELPEHRTRKATVVDLKDACKQLNITVSGKAKKDDIIAELREMATKMNLHLSGLPTEEQLLLFVQQCKKQIGDMREKE